MIPEQEKLFWHWVNERHRITVKRQQGKPWPWTADPILQKYKFTNVFRRLDRETEHLVKRIAALKGNSSRLRIFRHSVAFRLFCWHETYDTLNRAGVLDTWDRAAAHKAIAERDHKQVFTGAYIIPNMGETRPKVDLILDALTHLWCDAPALLQEMRWHNSIQHAVDLFRRYRGVGGFIGYELACDLTYFPILNKAEDMFTWANPGPGAHRGLNRLFGRKMSTRGRTDQANKDMQRLLLASKRKANKHVPPMQMRDIEHSLCEFDKYMRVHNGEEKRPKGVYRPGKKCATNLSA